MLPFDEAGDGPAIVLLHAGVADRTMWTEHLAPLAAAGHRVVAFDLPGFGEAPVPQGEDAPWIAVLQAMDALAIERAALVGCSFGGAVALRVAAVAPERVTALAVCSAPFGSAEPSAELRAAWAAEEDALERGDTDAAVDAVVATWTLPGASATLRARVATMQRRAFAQQARASAPEAPDPLDGDPQALGRLAVPVLVMVGEHDRPDFHEAAALLTQTLPGARAERIAGAGHLAPLETPETFRGLVLDLLA